MEKIDFLLRCILGGAAFLGLVFVVLAFLYWALSVLAEDAKQIQKRMRRIRDIDRENRGSTTKPVELWSDQHEQGGKR